MSRPAGPLPKTMSSDESRIPAAALASFIKHAFETAGLPENDAEAVAGLMVEADLRGSDTHGVIRLPLYLRRLKAGGVNARPNIRVVQEKPSTALIDGDNGIGHLVMRFAAMTAIEKAKHTGVAWVGARLSNHAGPAALYATMPLAHDMIGLYLAVGSNNHLPPWGSTENLLGTNPLAVAIPAGEEPPIVLDMAPTVAAFGKVRLKAQRGEEMPVGWMIGRDGKPLTDPKRADEGLLLPIGDYKGSGLSLIIGLLAGTLNGAAFGREVTTSSRSRARPPIPAMPSSRCRSNPSCRRRRSSSMSMRRSAPCAAPNACPAWSASGCPASRAISSGRIAWPTASRCPSRCAPASTPRRAISTSRRCGFTREPLS
jgi:L-2-hydroxycarboxylate dehydrogenase (NAD+)